MHARQKLIRGDLKDFSQDYYLKITHKTDSPLDARNDVAARVPTRQLTFHREIALRPIPAFPEFSDDRAGDVDERTRHVAVRGFSHKRLKLLCD
jgi:hypothetical protein